MAGCRCRVLCVPGSGHHWPFHTGLSLVRKTPPIRVDRGELAARLHKHVDVLAGLIGPRFEGRPTSLEAARAYIQRELAAGGEAVHEERFPSREGREAVNLLVTRAGRGIPEEIVVLGAHYDTVPDTPGADDNASAVACLLEAGRLLQGVESARTIRLVAFANEEPPHFYAGTMGSQHHAWKARQAEDAIKAMVCLEMVGYFSDEPGSQRYPTPVHWLGRRLFGDRGRFIAVVSNMQSAGLLWPFRRGFRAATRIPLAAIPLPQRINDIRRSDHGPFWDEGFPAVMVTDTSFYRNPNYHQPGDVPDTLNYLALAEVTCGVAGAVARLAGGRLRFSR